MKNRPSLKHCRTIFISDVHLGTKGCKAELLNSFLKAHRCENLFLVGDIIDGWRISSTKWYWPSAHNRVVRQILHKSEKEKTNVFYVVGNHDEFLREYIAEHNFEMGNIKIVNEFRHETAKGENLWVIHGDAYDGITRHHRWVALAGDAGYNFLLWSNRWFNGIRRAFNLPYWSLSKAIKHKVKKAVSYIFEYENTIARETAKRKLDGVVCGHIHHAEMKTINGIRYYNCGDWVESCTAIVEDMAGNLDIVTWTGSDVDHAEKVIYLDNEDSAPGDGKDRKVA
jgi:UDP-2,3-diacylglucosamine pyrophosphatase LpxH